MGRSSNNLNHPLRLAVLAVMTAALPATAQQASASSCGAEVSLSSQGGTYQVTGRFTVEAPAEVVWAVLTDYDHLADFVSGMKDSRIVAHAQDAVFVEQNATAHALIFSRDVHLMLRIRETNTGSQAGSELGSQAGSGTGPATRSLDFRDISQRDFQTYQGTWTVVPAVDGASVQVQYQLSARPRTYAPASIGASVFRSTAAQLLTQLRAEMLRRAARVTPTVRIPATGATDSGAPLAAPNS